MATNRERIAWAELIAATREVNALGRVTVAEAELRAAAEREEQARRQHGAAVWSGGWDGGLDWGGGR